MFQFPRLPPAPYFIQVRAPGHDPRRVPPFGNPRIEGRLRLPGAYRSLPRPSSASRAKASAVRPWYLLLTEAHGIAYDILAPTIGKIRNHRCEDAAPPEAGPLIIKISSLSRYEAVKVRGGRARLPAKARLSGALGAGCCEEADSRFRFGL